MPRLCLIAGKGVVIIYVVIIYTIIRINKTRKEHTGIEHGNEIRGILRKIGIDLRWKIAGVLLFEL